MATNMQLTLTGPIVALLVLYISTNLAPVSAASSTADLHCMFFGFPELEYDGKDRTEPLTDRTFNKTIKASGAKSVVFFTDTEADDDEYDQYECFMQLSAQIMEKRGYKFFTVNTTQNVRLRRQEDVEKGEDTIHVYKDRNQIEYFGVRDPDTFVSWLMDVPDEDLTIISDKEDRRDFEEMANTHTRLIGYFEPGSDELEEFEEAAEEFMGEVEFFAVVSSKWAKRFDLDEVGEVHMYRPYEKKPIELPKSVDTEHEFEDWVEKHKDPIMQKMSLENYYNVWKDPEEDEFLILAFADDETPEGRALVDLLIDLTNENTEHAGKLEIVVIDPTEFPLMVDIWEEMFGVEIEAGPIIGYVDISEREGIWFEMDQLNLNDPAEYDEENEEVLQRWLDQIINGQISLDDRMERARSRQQLDQTVDRTGGTDRELNGIVSHRRLKKLKKTKVKSRKRKDEQGSGDGEDVTHYANILDNPSLYAFFDAATDPSTTASFQGDDPPGAMSLDEICDEFLMHKIQVLQAEIAELRLQLRTKQNTGDLGEEFVATDEGFNETVLEPDRAHSEPLTKANIVKGRRMPGMLNLTRFVKYGTKGHNWSQNQNDNLPNDTDSRTAPKTAPLPASFSTVIAKNHSLIIHTGGALSVADPSFPPLGTKPKAGRYGRRGRSDELQLRRCRRSTLYTKCNIIERHMRLNPIVAYFIFAGLVAVLRAMRITLSFYICPRIDDWRDRLRALGVPLVG